MSSAFAGEMEARWPEQEPVVFNVRMPQGAQRLALFDKVLLMNEKRMRKHERDTTRRTNASIVKNRDAILYERYVADLRKLYPAKLRNQATHRAKRNAHAWELASQRTALKNQPPYPGPRKRTSSESVNVVEGPRSSFLDEKVNRKFNQSNVLNNLSPRRVQEAQRNLNALMQQANPPLQLPLDAGGQEDVTLSFVAQPHSQLNNSILESELRRIQASKRRVSRLMYGKQGLIAFLYHLFGLLSEKQMKRVTYYFALKGQLEALDAQAQRAVLAEQERRANEPILELEEEKSPTNSKRQTAKTVSPQDSRPRMRSKNNSSLNCGSSSSTSGKFKSERDWVSLDQWESQAPALYQTPQFLAFKMKAFETFECYEDAFSLIWGCLLEFPRSRFFPVQKFQLIWDSLTQTQQQELFSKLGQRQDRPCCKIVSVAYKLRASRSTAADTASGSVLGSFFGGKATFKSDEGVFGGATLTKTVVQKKKEKKERDS